MVFSHLMYQSNTYHLKFIGKQTFNLSIKTFRLKHKSACLGECNGERGRNLYKQEISIKGMESSISHFS